MPISTKTHDQVAMDGKPYYIIKTPNPEFTGKRYKIRFFNGEGRTKFRKKAVMFDRVLGYEVLLHEDIEPWDERLDTNESIFDETEPEMADESEEPRKQRGRPRNKAVEKVTDESEDTGEENDNEINDPNDAEEEE